MNKWTLRFEEVDMEKEFNESYLESELKVIQYSMLLGIVMYFIFLFLDLILYDEVLLKKLIVFRVIIAVIIAIHYGLSYKIVKTPKQYQILALSVAAFCFGSSIILAFFNGIDIFYFYTASLIIIAFVFNLLNIRFFYLIFMSIFFVITCFFVFYLSSSYTFKIFTHQVYGMVSVVAVSLIAVRIIEFQKRQDFLNKRLIQAQKNALEKSVVEKDKLLLMLEERNEELDTFNYSVSHDLKTPLRNINSFSKLLEKRYKDQLDGNGLEYLGFIVEGTAKMNRLIDDLLRYSKIRHTELKLEMLNMGMMVEGIFLEFSQSMDEKPDFIFDNLPNVKGDKILIKQVWDNLISNAIKYSSKNEQAQIVVGATKSEEEITYYIKDNGVGFDMKLSSRLFELFSRLHSDSEYAGTGVGLSLADRIVKKHNGKIWAESVVEQGSTFYFTLPIR